MVGLNSLPMIKFCIVKYVFLIRRNSTIWHSSLPISRDGYTSLLANSKGWACQFPRVINYACVDTFSLQPLSGAYCQEWTLKTYSIFICKLAKWMIQVTTVLLLEMDKTFQLHKQNHMICNTLFMQQNLTIKLCYPKMIPIFCNILQ